MLLWTLLTISVVFPRHQPTTAPAADDSPNEYYQLLALKKDAEDRIPVSQRKEKAQVIAGHVLATAEKLDYCSYDLAFKYYWCFQDSPRSRRPLKDWINEERLVIHVASSRQSVSTQILLKGNLIHDYFLNDDKVQEFMHPHDGLCGKTAVYPVDGKSLRLREGINDDLFLCSLPLFLHVHVGPNPYGPTRKRNDLAQGEWIGRMKGRDGERLDVVFSSGDRDEKDGHWAYYFVNDAGFIRTQLNVRHAEGYEKFNRVLWFMDYNDYSMSKIPQATFSPPPELLEKAKGWKVLTEKESLALRDRQSGNRGIPTSSSIDTPN